MKISLVSSNSMQYVKMSYCFPKVWRNSVKFRGGNVLVRVYVLWCWYYLTFHNSQVYNNRFIAWANLIEWIQKWHEIQERAYKEFYEKNILEVFLYRLRVLNCCEKTYVKAWHRELYDTSFFFWGGYESTASRENTLISAYFWLSEKDRRENLILAGAYFINYFGHANLWPSEVLFSRQEIHNPCIFHDLIIYFLISHFIWNKLIQMIKVLPSSTAQLL